MMTKFEKVRQVLFSITSKDLKKINKKAIFPYPQHPDKMKPEELENAIVTCKFPGTKEEIAAAVVIDSFMFLFTSDEVYASPNCFSAFGLDIHAVEMPVRYADLERVGLYSDCMDMHMLRNLLKKTVNGYGVCKLTYKDGRVVNTYVGMFCVFMAEAINKILVNIEG